MLTLGAGCSACVSVWPTPEQGHGFRDCDLTVAEAASCSTRHPPDVFQPSCTVTYSSSSCSACRPSPRSATAARRCSVLTVTVPPLCCRTGTYAMSPFGPRALHGTRAPADAPPELRAGQQSESTINPLRDASVWEPLVRLTLTGVASAAQRQRAAGRRTVVGGTRDRRRSLRRGWGEEGGERWQSGTAWGELRSCFSSSGAGTIFKLGGGAPNIFCVVDDRENPRVPPNPVSRRF